MRNSRLAVHLSVLLLAGSLQCLAQGRKFPTPPQPADRSISNQKIHTTQSYPPLDFLELQRESKDLADLARTVPGDIESVIRGLLPKDLAEKLKRIEKLSKHLRSEISH
jgi:hypothetical protein